MNSRGRRTQRRAEERRAAKKERAALLPLQRSFRVKKKKKHRES